MAGYPATSKENIEKIREMYLSGMKYEDIAIKLNVSTALVGKIASKEGFARNKIAAQRGKVVERVTEKIINETAERLAIVNKEFLGLNETMLRLTKSKVSAIIKKITDEKGQIVNADQIDAGELKKIADIAHELMLDFRLQTGQTTSNEGADEPDGDELEMRKRALQKIFEVEKKKKRPQDARH